MTLGRDGIMAEYLSDGGVTMLGLPSREEAVACAARIARACRFARELRAFQFDPRLRG